MLLLKSPRSECFQIIFANRFSKCKTASTINESSKTVVPEERQKGRWFSNRLFICLSTTWRGC